MGRQAGSGKNRFPMHTKAVFSVLLCFTMIFGGLFVPLVGLGTSHIPPVEQGVSIKVQFGTSTPAVTPSPSPIPGVLSPEPFQLPPIGSLILRGFAPPGSFLTVKRDKIVSATVRVSGAGTFDILLVSLSANTYEIRISIEDGEGNISQSIVLPSIPIFKDATTTIENIFIPPTLFLSSRRIVGNQDLTIRGFSAPNANVILYFSPSRVVKTVQTSSTGRWEVILGAGELSAGKYRVRAHTQLASGLLSGFSEEFDLEIIAPPFFRPEPPPSLPPGEPLPPPGENPADFNEDGRVDLIDFSILLYNWETPQDSRTDLNKDRVVDLVDFSVVLFLWTG